MGLEGTIGVSEESVMFQIQIFDMANSHCVLGLITSSKLSQV